MRDDACSKNSSSFASVCTVGVSPLCTCRRARATDQRRSTMASCESSATRRPLSRTSSATTCETSCLCCEMMSALARDHSTLVASFATQSLAPRPPSIFEVGPRVALASPRTSSGKRVKFQVARASVSNENVEGGARMSPWTLWQSRRTAGCLVSSSRNLKELLVAIVFSASSATEVVKLAPFSLTIWAHLIAEAFSTCCMISLRSCGAGLGAQ
mmetsp:Transcript_65297/g.147334  ORF Transcript_65297/g.147334 Transcript_65297/m.147334 type:complete len:214 (-) Transcript_65297:160-801(-)